jgi:altronate dehydratase large subunit
VAQDIAGEVGGVAIVHQHGCSQIGDDEVQTATAFERIACNPNVGAVLVVSLGCETVQGREVARAIAERGQRVELVGIQDSGGSEAAVADGRTLARGLADELRAQSRVPIDAGRLVVGIEASRDSEAVAELARAVAETGASLVLGSAESVPEELARICRTAPAFGDAARGGASHLVLEGAGSAAEQHTAIVAAGAQLVVSFPDDGEAPVGFPLCPVVSVAGRSPLHVALADEFDAVEPVQAEELWRRIAEVLSGRPSAAETLGPGTFALSRLARSM